MDDIDEVEDIESEEQIEEAEIAGRFSRFFSYSEDDCFAIFVECGLHRKIKAVPTKTHDAVELSIEIPLPSDKLFHKAGFKHASKVSFEETRGVFLIQAPGDCLL